MVKKHHINIFTLMRRAGFDWFVFALASVIVIAYFFPHIGEKKSPIPFSTIASAGVSLIFLFYGLTLGPKKLLSGIGNLRLHLLIQLTCFVFFPLLILSVKAILGQTGDTLLWTGLFFLACLPGTVSSAVIMTSIAQGNVSAAIFNASIGTLLGIFITPAFTGIYLGTTGLEINFWPVLFKLFIQVLLPVIVGMLLHKHLKLLAEKIQKIKKYFDQSVILLIVYTAFCESFANGVFKGYSAALLLYLTLALFLLFCFTFTMLIVASNVLKFSYPDKITAIFSGSQKSLVHGSVMSKFIFAGSPYVGVILLPVMIYHAIQLVLVSIIAGKFSRNLQKNLHK